MSDRIVLTAHARERAIERCEVPEGLDRRQFDAWLAGCARCARDEGELVKIVGGGAGGLDGQVGRIYEWGGFRWLIADDTALISVYDHNEVDPEWMQSRKSWKGKKKPSKQGGHHVKRKKRRKRCRSRRR